MTTANHAEIFLRSAGRYGYVVGTEGARAGDWTYTGWTPHKAATLRNEGREVDLHYSSSIFEDFLEEMSRIQNEFRRRSPNSGPSETAVGECFGEILGV
ncbi:MULTISPECIES: hypothetical protein [unclassified Streptomyces]|uniref:hypothetical protein n=1 Tax=unclassified Streptomyces TaxID=2593676 RepID=UPI00109EA564|nr:hypothetical protein [Streptomyces sp. A1136]THA51637.1 hypothetical protein E6R62_22290 [Streptomyces sp. A1136]